MGVNRRVFLKLGAALLLPGLAMDRPRIERIPESGPPGWDCDRDGLWIPTCDLCERTDLEDILDHDSDQECPDILAMYRVHGSDGFWQICEDCILQPQPRPGVEVRLTPFCCGEGFEGLGLWYQAFEIGQGYETRFWRCPLWYPQDVIQIGGVWCWELDEDRPHHWNRRRLMGQYHYDPG